MQSTPDSSALLVRTFAFSMIAAPFVQLVADILWLGNGVIFLGTVLRQISYVLFIPAVLGAGYFAPSKVKGIVASWLCLLGIAGGIAIVALFRVGAGSEIGQSGLPLFVEQAFAAHAGIGISIFIPGIFFPLGHLAFSLAFWKEKRTRLLSLLFLIAGILFFMGNALSIKGALFTSDSLMIIIYAWIVQKNIREPKLTQTFDKATS